MQQVYDQLSANIDKVCKATRKYVKDSGSYMKAANIISKKSGVIVDDKALERLANGKYLDQFKDKLRLIVWLGEWFGIDLILKKDGKSVAEDKLDRIRKILDE